VQKSTLELKATIPKSHLIDNNPLFNRIKPSETILLVQF